MKNKFNSIACKNIYGDIYELKINDIVIDVEKSDLRLIIEKIDNEII